MLSLKFALRFAYGAGARKKIAREFNVSVETAKMWLSGQRQFPLARRAELAERIRERLIERDRLSNEIWRQLPRGNRETVSEVVSLEVRRHAVPTRNEADELGR